MRLSWGVESDVCLVISTLFLGLSQDILNLQQRILIEAIELEISWCLLVPELVDEKRRKLAVEETGRDSFYSGGVCET